MPSSENRSGLLNPYIPPPLGALGVGFVVLQILLVPLLVLHAEQARVFQGWYRRLDNRTFAMTVDNEHSTLKLS